MNPNVTVRSPDAPTYAGLTIRGEQIILHAERAAELPHTRTLIIADVHWGKATALRAHGVPVPAGGTTADLLRLDALLHRTHAEHLLVLGDLAHSRHGWDERALQPVLAWRSRWSALRITLVRGNHDAHAGDPPASLNITAVDAPLTMGALTFAHDPLCANTASATGDAAERVAEHAAEHADHDGARVPYRLCGHVHPTIKLSGRGGDRLRLPCFVVGPNCLILPAFSAFTGSGAWTRQADEGVFVIVDDHVIELPLY